MNCSQNQQQLDLYNYMQNYYQNSNPYMQQIGYYPQQFQDNYYDEHQYHQQDEDYANYFMQDFYDTNRYIHQGINIGNQKNRSSRYNEKNRRNKFKKYVKQSSRGIKNPTRTSKRIAKQKKVIKPSEFTDQFELSSQSPVACDNQRVQEQDQYFENYFAQSKKYTKQTEYGDYDDYDDLEQEQEEQEELQQYEQQQQEDEQEQQQEDEQEQDEQENQDESHNNQQQPKISKKKKVSKGNNIIKLKLMDNQQSVQLITPMKKVKRKGIIGRPKGSKNKKTLLESSQIYSIGYQKQKQDDHHLSDNEKGGALRNRSGSSHFTPKSDNGLKFNSLNIPQNDSNNTIQIDGSAKQERAQIQLLQQINQGLQQMYDHLQKKQQSLEKQQEHHQASQQHHHHHPPNYDRKRKLSSGPDGVVFYELDSGAVTVPLQNLRVQIPTNLLKNIDYPVIVKKRNLQEVKDQNRMIGKLTAKERRQKIYIYKKKKQRRIWSKKINYDCRKRVADNRLRIKGRFVTKNQAFQILKTTPQDLQNNPQLRKILHNSQNCEIKTDENSIKVRNLQALLEIDAIKKEDIPEEQDEDQDQEEEEEDDDEEKGDENNIDDDNQTYDYSYSNNNKQLNRTDYKKKGLRKKVQNSGIDKRLKTKFNSKNKNQSSRMTVTVSQTNKKNSSNSTQFDVPDRINQNIPQNKLASGNIGQLVGKSHQKTHQQLHFEVLSKNADGKVTELKIENICRRKTSLDADLGSRLNKNFDSMAPRFIFVKPQSRKCSMIYEEQDNQYGGAKSIEKSFRIERPHPRKKVPIRQLNRPSPGLMQNLELINQQIQSMKDRLPSLTFEGIYQFSEPQKTELFTKQLQIQVQTICDEITELEAKIREEQNRQCKRNTAYVIEQHKQKEKRIENSINYRNKFEIMHQSKRQVKRELLSGNPQNKQYSVPLSPRFNEVKLQGSENEKKKNQVSNIEH